MLPRDAVVCKPVIASSTPLASVVKVAETLVGLGADLNKSQGVSGAEVLGHDEAADLARSKAD